jgi:hypothetical protein
MPTSVLLTAFLIPGVLVCYWVVVDWLKERSMRRRWIRQPFLSDAFKRPRAQVVTERSQDAA